MPFKTDPVWTLSRRRVFSRLAYWLKVFGFNLHDRSASNLLYLLYFCAFWFLWVLAVFGFLGSELAKIFVSLPGISPFTLGPLLGLFIMLVWGIIKFFQVTRRSPFVFSEQDAYLICQSPVSRKKVGLAWFLMDWFGIVLPFAAGFVLLSFTLTNISLFGVSSFQSLPTYLFSGLRSLAILLPLQMGLQAGLYGLGAWRLRRDKPENRLLWVRIIVLILSLGLLGGLFTQSWREVILLLMSFLFQAAFGHLISPTSWGIGFIISLIILGLGVRCLLKESEKMHLGRAAEETQLESVLRSTRIFLRSELGEVLKSREKLKVTYPPSQFPEKKGGWMLIWKNFILSTRSVRARLIMRWINVFLLGASIFLLSGGGLQLLSGVIWAVLLGGLITERLRNELSNWWLLRSLPFKNSQILFALLGPTTMLGIFLGWASQVLVSPFTSFGWLHFALLPFLVVIAALGTSQDILAQARSSVLIEPSIGNENVPRQDIQGILITMISVGLPLWLLTLSSSQAGGFLAGYLSLPIAILITVLLFRAVLTAFRWIA